jgi:aminopeptidase
MPDVHASIDSADARMRAFARLLVRTGVNLNEGQELLLQAQHEHAPFVRALAREAYAAGARFVDVAYADRWVQRAFVETAPDEMLGWTPPWMVARLERAIEVGAAIIGVSADSGAEVYEGLDGERLARARFRDFDRVWMDGVMGRKLAWSLVAYPTEGWAREALGEADVDRLWDAFAHALRLDEPDPAAAWEARLDELQARARELTAREFTALRYRGPGTDLEVGLLEGGRWLAGRERTVHGQVHAPNLPTEEVFTSPHRERAEGTVRSTMPLALHGTIVEGLELRVAGGEIVEARATRGEEALRTELALDDGARRFGEVALVDASSRVGETGVIFNNTLFDENAAAHIAWGNALPWVLDHVPEDQHLAAGLNQSATHTDFMVGAPEVEIDGVEAGGTAVALLREGIWQL